MQRYAVRESFTMPVILKAMYIRLFPLITVSSFVDEEWWSFVIAFGLADIKARFLFKYWNKKLILLVVSDISVEIS